MKTRQKGMMLATMTTLVAAATLLSAAPVPADDPVGLAVEAYFKKAFEGLKAVADQQPTTESFRDAMKPLAEGTDGFFGGTLIDTDFVIREVYFARDFLARGYDLNKVKQLTVFWKEMREKPEPQLSEPARGNIMQPRLVAMRYPVIKDGKLAAVVSMMVRTEAFLKATGLDTCKGYRITCRGVKTEEEGKLAEPVKTVTLQLPANEWRIEYSR
jgi:hypothetical protein